MLPIWLLAAMVIMMYYWRFWEPWANAMLAILLPKLWFGLKIMTGTPVFACLPGAHPYWTQKKLQNELAQLFLHVFLVLTLTGPRKASKQQFYIID